MKRTRLLFIPLAFLVLSTTTGCQVTYGEKEYYIKNQYFSNSDTWTGRNDPSIDFIENKFGIKIARTGAYTWNDWQTQVITDVNDVKGCPDIFHYSMDNKNFNAIQEWAELGLIRNVPYSLISKHENLKKQVDSLSAKEYLKINGELYGLPLMRDMANPSKNFTNATYLYRKDILEGDAEGKALIKDDDTYSLEEFLKILRYFKNKCVTTQQHPFLEVGWGVLSLIDLYRKSLTCFTRNAQGEVVNNFLTDEYLTGLKLCKDLINEGLMCADNMTQKNENWGVDQYGDGNAFVVFQNFDFANYVKLRKSFQQYLEKTQPGLSPIQIADKVNKGTTFMKIKGPDGKIPAEGNENWYSITLFKDGMSDTKLDKYLEILDYLIGDVSTDDLFSPKNDGRRLATYGVEGLDYVRDIRQGGEVIPNFDIPTSRWKKKDGKYTAIDNGAKFLRYTISVNEEVNHLEPCADQTAYTQLSDWKTSVIDGKESGAVRVVLEDDDIRWADCPKKVEFNAIMLSDATKEAKKYVVTPGMTIEDFKKNINKNTHWGEVLKELNDKLRK